MFIGHFAAGFAAKRLAPEANLGLLFVACQLLDLIWPVLVLAGVERVAVDHAATAVTPLDFQHYPFSHSLVMTALYAAVFGLAAGALLRSRRAALVVAALTLSHWFLDFATHRPDMPLTFSETRLGLGLWNSIPLTVAIEGALFVAGFAVYWQRQRGASKPRKGWTLGLFAFLLLIYAGNVFGPKPPLDTPAAAIAGPALAMWLIVLWAYAIDRQRLPP